MSSINIIGSDRNKSGVSHIKRGEEMPLTEALWYVHVKLPDAILVKIVILNKALDWLKLETSNDEQNSRLLLSQQMTGWVKYL